MKKEALFSIFLLLGTFLNFTNCKNEKIHAEPLSQLLETYENGVISECMFNGAIVYTAELNTHDAILFIYDMDGNQIGNCHWAQPDQMCSELKECEVIYRVNNNIWGQPAVNKYGF